MTAVWTIETGTNSFDGHAIDWPTTETVVSVFRTLTSYLAATPGIQDAWIDGDTVTVHTTDDRWVTFTAGSSVPDTQMDAVMAEIRPIIAVHEA